VHAELENIKSAGEKYEKNTKFWQATDLVCLVICFIKASRPHAIKIFTRECLQKLNLHNSTCLRLISMKPALKLQVQRGEQRRKSKLRRAMAMRQLHTESDQFKPCDYAATV
jgi:hypothetical protein